MHTVSHHCDIFTQQAGKMDSSIYLDLESDSTKDARRSTWKDETGRTTTEVVAICVCAWQLPVRRRIPAAFTADIAAAILRNVKNGDCSLLSLPALCARKLSDPAVKDRHSAKKYYTIVFVCTRKYLCCYANLVVSRSQQYSSNPVVASQRTTTAMAHPLKQSLCSSSRCSQLPTPSSVATTT